MADPPGLIGDGSLAFLVSEEAVVRKFGPEKIHFHVVHPDEFADAGDFPVRQPPSLRQNAVPVPFNEKFRRTGFGQFYAAGMGVHRLDYAVGCEV